MLQGYSFRIAFLAWFLDMPVMAIPSTLTSFIISVPVVSSVLSTGSLPPAPLNFMASDMHAIRIIRITPAMAIFL